MASAIYCNFCGKEKAYVRYLVGGPNVTICDECVDLCVATLAEAKAKKVIKMTDIENPAGKVAGYTAQPDAKVALVNEFKADEERLLRKLDALADSWSHAGVEENIDAIKRGFMKIGGPTYDQALISEARKTLMVGFMLLNRAVFQPQRIKLPEDGE